jgi:hypothetical protein
MIKKLRNELYAPKWEQRGRTKIIFGDGYKL